MLQRTLHHKKACSTTKKEKEKIDVSLSFKKNTDQGRDYVHVSVPDCADLCNIFVPVSSLTPISFLVHSWQGCEGTSVSKNDLLGDRGVS